MRTQRNVSLFLREFRRMHRNRGRNAWCPLQHTTVVTYTDTGFTATSKLIVFGLKPRPLYGREIAKKGDG